jgi:hypothetical protein
MKIKISCEDKYETQKLASLIFIKDSNETFVTKILNIVENEADFIQSVVEKEQKIVSTKIFDTEVEIEKE